MIYATSNNKIVSLIGGSSVIYDKDYVKCKLGELEKLATKFKKKLSNELLDKLLVKEADKPLINHLRSIQLDDILKHRSDYLKLYKEYYMSLITHPLISQCSNPLQLLLELDEITDNIYEHYNKRLTDEHVKANHFIIWDELLAKPLESINIYEISELEVKKLGSARRVLDYYMEKQAQKYLANIINLHSIFGPKAFNLIDAEAQKFIIFSELIEESIIHRRLKERLMQAELNEFLEEAVIR